MWPINFYQSATLPTGPPLTTNPSACGSNFTCGDGSCVRRSTVCNFVPDCRDGSDEAQCGMFYFSLHYLLVSGIIMLTSVKNTNMTKMKWQNAYMFLLL